MKKKIIIIAALFAVVLLGIISILTVNFRKRACIEDSKKIIEEKLNIISEFVNKYEVKESGHVLVNANYKGAHGENYPAVFDYKFEYDDKLYFENEKYSYFNISRDLFDIIGYLSRVSDIDVSNYSELKRDKGSYCLIYDAHYINEVLETNFDSVKVLIETKGLANKVDLLKIILDDILIFIDKDSIKVNYKDNDIEVKLGESAHYININDKLKMNIFVKDSYTFSIVLNNQVYSLEVKDGGLFIKFNTGAAIYNSITLDVSYDDVILDKYEEDNLDDNPIIRYLNDSDLSIWR